MILISPHPPECHQLFLSFFNTEEEKRFHLKKETGPIYDLNQRLIAEIIQVPKAELVKEHFLTICSGENFSESWKLLELSIKLGKNIFIIPSNVTGIQRSMTEGMIEDYVEATREILLSFIAQIQSISPTPNCLKEEIPELDQFFNEIKYLQEDIDTKKIFEGKDQKIFEKLKHYPHQRLPDAGYSDGNSQKSVPWCIYYVNPYTGLIFSTA